MLVYTLVSAFVLTASGRVGLTSIYFFGQDAPLLAAGGLFLLILGNRSGSAITAVTITPRWSIAAITTVAIIAYIGSYVVIERYGVSRDEDLADFAAGYLAQGKLAAAIPPNLAGIAEAMMPLWAAEHIPNGYWYSNYLPVGSAIRALFGLLGDRWLAGPVLLAVGLFALRSSARRIWPTKTAPRTVALVVALSSTQLLANAMTPYAMTAHFALNALWLACFLRGGRFGHGAAIAIGLAATGLHQLQFHIMFVSGFIIWSWASGKRAVAITYATACIGYIVVWDNLYHPLLINALTGAAPVGPVAGSGSIAIHLQRLRDLEPLTSLARFAAWNNVVLLPLALVGAYRWRDRDRRPNIMMALAISSSLGLATMVFQGHGYGYRYLHGLIPCFCLLAGEGWQRLGVITGRRVPAAALWASVWFAALVTAPFALWRSHQFVHPYASAYRIARAAPADVVLVDSRGAAYLQDIVRIDGPIRRPLVLDLAYVKPSILDRLCSRYRVMLFSGAQASQLGLIPRFQPDDNDDKAAERRAQLSRLHCGVPVPVPASGSNN